MFFMDFLSLIQQSTEILTGVFVLQFHDFYILFDEIFWKPPFFFTSKY